MKKWTSLLLFTLLLIAYSSCENEIEKVVYGLEVKKVVERIKDEHQFDNIEILFTGKTQKFQDHLIIDCISDNELTKEKRQKRLIRYNIANDIYKSLNIETQKKVSKIDVFFSVLSKKFFFTKGKSDIQTFNVINGKLEYSLQ